MTITHDFVAQLFNHLQTNNSKTFFEHVVDDVEWTVMGTHPLAGTYISKQEFIEHTLLRLNKILVDGVILKVRHITIQEDTAVVEMVSLSTAKNGKPFKNTYCWVVTFKNDMIVAVRAYVDSALVQRLIDENEEAVA